MEIEIGNAHQIWLAVQSLNKSLNVSVNELSDPNVPELIDIKSNIETIRRSASQSEFIRELVNSVSEKSLENGVYTELSLKERFDRVKKVCKKVSLIDDRGGSLVKYFVSYLQSLFIFETRIDKDSLEVANDALEVDNLNTFKIVDYAQHFIDNGNLELAIKLLLQLKGEPQRAARDWIKDAILLLEIKQTCQILTSYVSSVYISSDIH